MPDDPSVLMIEMQSRPEGFGLCYECRDGQHDSCVGIPCDCSCGSAPASRLVDGGATYEGEP